MAGWHLWAQVPPPGISGVFWARRAVPQSWQASARSKDLFTWEQETLFLVKGGGAPLAKIAVFPATLHGSFSTHIQVGARTGEEPGLCASQTLPFHDCQPCLGQCPGLLLGRECNGQLLTEAGARAHLPPRGGLLH